MTISPYIGKTSNSEKDTATSTFLPTLKAIWAYLRIPADSFHILDTA